MSEAATSNVSCRVSSSTSTGLIPVHDEAEGAGPPIPDVGKCLGIDFSALQRCSDLVEGRFLLTGERLEYESKVLTEILTVKYCLGGGREFLVIHVRIAPNG